MVRFIKKNLGISSDDERRRKLYEEQLPPESMRVSRAKLISCIPEIHPEVRRISDKRYGCLLEWDLSDAQRVAPKKSFFPKFFFTQKKTHRLVLDDLGRRTVDLMNGRRCISEIATELQRGTTFSQTQLEDAVLAFAGQLIRKNVASLAPKSK